MNNALQFITNLINRLGRQPSLTLRQVLQRPNPWWVKVCTQNPTCTYYFGPFDSKAEAMAAQAGYIEDLEQENAEDIQVDLQRCSAQRLTLD